MPKIKKIYRYEDRLVYPCKWCEGTGINLKAFRGMACFVCRGTRGIWKTIKILVGEEVTK